MKTSTIIYYFIILFSFTSILLGQDNAFIFQYPSAKEIDIMVNSNVSLKERRYIYEYELTSLLSSRQDIWTFSVAHEGIVLNLKSPVGWEGETLRGIPRISWGSSDSTRDIQPSEKLVGFSYESSGLPCVKYFLSSGWVPTPVLETEPDSIIGNSIFENSKSGKTLGPKGPPDPLIPTVFLDTLIYYTQESLKLGWITDQSTSDKYGSYFTTAKTQVQQNNINSARNTLESVLQDVNQDSGAVLTSEAYALLRYNTEYLLNQLVESEVTIDDLIAYINESYETGAIDNKGIANSLIAKLSTAKKQLEKEKTKQAVNALNAFLNELEAQNEKHVNIEVYNYLKENVEAIIEKLSGE